MCFVSCSAIFARWCSGCQSIVLKVWSSGIEGKTPVGKPLCQLVVKGCTLRVVLCTGRVKSKFMYPTGIGHLNILDTIRLVVSNLYPG